MTTFLPYGRQMITDGDKQAVLDALAQDFITRGPLVEKFEEELKKATGAAYCVVMNSGTSALQAAYFAANGGESDRILSTPNTYIASIGTGVQRGMTPVFVDIDRKTGHMDFEKTIDNLDFQSTRGRLFIVPVHFTGTAFDMKKLNSQIKNVNSIVIEDAAHALGSEYPSGEKVGSCAYSDMTILSFHPVKTITTGEGGAVTTNDEKLYERLKLYRNNAMVRSPTDPWYYEVGMLTGNYNFTEFQAALGLSQLKRLDKIVLERRHIVKRYRENLKGVPGLTLLSDAQDDYTSYHLMVVQIENLKRTQLMAKLKDAGIGTQLHYIPVYRHPVFSNKEGDLSEYFPEMEAYYSQALSIPLYNGLSLESVDYVSEKLKEFIK